MDIKEVKAVSTPIILPENNKYSESAASSKNKQKAELSSTYTPSVTVDVHSTKNTPSDSIPNLNELISTVNVASQAVEEIDRYVRGISGIVEQAYENLVPEGRLSILESEANQLVNAIKKTLQAQAPNGVRPLQGESFKAELEETLGKTLEIMLPDVSQDTLGLGQIKLTTKDFIVNTRASVLRSQERLQDLRTTLDISTQEIKNATAELSVATQNVEASQSTLRDVESALSFAGKMSEHISENPLEALGSATRLDPYALGLLR